MAGGSGSSFPTSEMQRISINKIVYYDYSMDICTWDMGKHLPSIRERFAAGSAEIRISGFSGNFGSVGRSSISAPKIIIVVQKV